MVKVTIIDGKSDLFLEKEAEEMELKLG